MRYKEFVNENFKYLDPNMQGGLARSGDEDAIRELQQWLNSNGYNAGAVDGKYGGRTARAVRKFQSSEITDYSHRILTLAADSTSTIFTIGASNAGGQVSAVDLEYIRISNLDDTTSIRLVVSLVDDQAEAAGSFHVELKPLKSHLISTKSAAIVAAEAAFVAYNSISAIQAVTPAGSSIDIELFTVSK